MAIFKIAETCSLSSLQWFVLAGEIIEGTVKKGMKITLIDQNQQEWVYAVSSIEFLTYSERRPSAEVAIVIKYSSEVELKTLSSFDLKGCDVNVR